MEAKTTKTGIAILISDNVVFKARSIMRNKKRPKGHSIERIIINFYAPNNTASKYIQQHNLAELNGEMDKSTFVIRMLTHLPVTYRKRQKNQ